MQSRLITRIQKLIHSILDPVCWKPLALGVAPAIEHLGILRTLDIDGIIDAGANRGQFSLACRTVFRRTPIVAFEPIPSEAEIFRRVHGGVSNIELIESALGDTAGSATLHLSGCADSSSLLPIGKNQSRLFAGTAEVGTIDVPVALLDAFSDRWAGRVRQLLKLDVQGFELSVLRGAKQTLGSCSYVYAECSEIPLYDGQALRPDVAEYLAEYGFQQCAVINPQYDGTSLIQADYLFQKTK